MIRAQLAAQPGGIFFLTDQPGDEDEINGFPALGAAGHVLSRALRAASLVDPAVLPRSYMAQHTREVARLCWERRAHSVSSVLDGAAGVPARALCADAKRRDECLTDGTLPIELAGLPGLGRLGFAVSFAWPVNFARVRQELMAARPNIVVSLGDIALWLLTGAASTDEWRGAPRLIPSDAPIMRGATEAECSFLSQLKILPTYPPTRINQQYKLLTPFVADLMKVRNEAVFPEIRPLTIAVWLEPTLGDLEDFLRDHVAVSDLLTLDIETAVGQIVCVQIGTSPTTALVLPFVDYRKPSRSYWDTQAEELAAWDWLERVLDTPQPKLMQNGQYDTFWLLDRAGLAVRNYRHDLRLVQHILSPEQPKSLAYMGALYTQMPAWKAAVRHGGTDDKRDS